MEECRLRVSENRVMRIFGPTKDEVMGVEKYTYEGLLIVLSPTRKETSYSDQTQTRDLFNILPTKLNTLLSPLL